MTIQNMTLNILAPRLAHLRPSGLLTTLLPAALLLLSACGTVDTVRTEIGTRETVAEELGGKAVLHQAQKRREPYRLHNEFWIGDGSTLLENGPPLPARFEKPGGFSFVHSEPLGLNQMADAVRRLTGIPVRIDPDATAGDRQAHIDYRDGTLSGFLAQLGTLYQLDWRHENGEIRLYRYDTKTWVIEALPGMVRIANAISSGVEGSSAGSAGSDNAATTSISNSQRTSMEAVVNIWTDIETTIRSILPRDASLSVLPSAGSITVRGRTHTLRLVDDQIRRLNRRLGRQIIVGFKVYAVSLERGSDYGVDLQGVINDLAGDWQLIFGSPAAGRVLGAGSFSAAVLDPTSRFGGSEAFLEALERNNNVAVVTQQGVMAMNGVPTPLNVVRQTAYIDSVSQTLTGGDLSTSSISQATVTTGFTLTLLPSIVDDQTVILRYNLAISDLRALRTVDTGNVSLQTPEVDQRASSQQVKLRHSQTLVLAGFDQSETSLEESGIGNPGNLLLGGRQNARRQRTLLVVTLTPYIQQPAAVRVSN